MNLNDTTYTNSTPHELYEGIADWPLSPGATKPSPVTTNLFSGYSIPGIVSMADDGGISVMHTVGSQEPTSLTREEQANDASYEMLASKRSTSSIALADGRIQEPHLHDILCGRGGSINSHPGNRTFRGWITQRKESYNLADTKADKTRITGEIMDQVRDQNPPGRFLHKIAYGKNECNAPYTTSGWWSEIDDMKALAKISQALREGAPAFRAMHDKKGKKKQQQNRKNTKRKQKKDPVVSPRYKRKPPPRMEAAPSGIKQEVASMPPTGTDGHELDVLFPTTNNIFATKSSNNGNLLTSYPLLHMGDYTASMDEVAGAIPPTPPTARKPSSVGPPGKFITPKYQFPPTPSTPVATNHVSPVFSPYGEAKAAWDAISFLPNLSPTAAENYSPLLKKPTLQRTHSLSFSDGDVHSVGSFNDPFDNDNHGNHKQETQRELDLEVPNLSQGLNQGDSRFPPPLAPTTPPHGLSFGRIGSVPGGNNHHRNSRHTSRKESSVSSKSWGSVSNLNNSKRKSIS